MARNGGGDLTSSECGAEEVKINCCSFCRHSSSCRSEGGARVVATKVAAEFRPVKKTESTESFDKDGNEANWMAVERTSALLNEFDKETAGGGGESMDERGGSCESKKESSRVGDVEFKSLGKCWIVGEGRGSAIST